MRQDCPRLHNVPGNVKSNRRATEESVMDLNSIAAVLVVAMGILLYLMRRRSRLGKRTPKF